MRNVGNILLFRCVAFCVKFYCTLYVFSGEKSSFLGKLFGSKRHKTPPPPSVLDLSGHLDTDQTSQYSTVEHVTFSAQFPPHDGTGVYPAEVCHLPAAPTVPTLDTRGEVVSRVTTPCSWWQPFRVAELTERGYSLPQKAGRRGVDVETQSDILDDTVEELLPPVKHRHRKNRVQRSQTLPENIAAITKQADNIDNRANNKTEHSDKRRVHHKAQHRLGPVPEIPRSDQSRSTTKESDDSSDETGVIYEDIRDHAANHNIDLGCSRRVAGIAEARTSHNRRHHSSKIKSKVFKKYKEQIEQQQQGRPRSTPLYNQYGMSKSRESGVNCVGLPAMLAPCSMVPESEYSNSYNQDQFYLQPTADGQRQSREGTAEAPRGMSEGREGRAEAPRGMSQSCYMPSTYTPSPHEVYGNDSGFYSPQIHAPNPPHHTDYCHDLYVPFNGIQIDPEQHHRPYEHRNREQMSYPYGFPNAASNYNYNKASSPHPTNSSTNSSRQTLATVVHRPLKPEQNSAPEVVQAEVHRTEQGEVEQNHKSSKRHKPGLTRSKKEEDHTTDCNGHLPNHPAKAASRPEVLYSL